MTIIGVPIRDIESLFLRWVAGFTVLAISIGVGAWGLRYAVSSLGVAGSDAMLSQLFWIKKDFTVVTPT